MEKYIGMDVHAQSTTCAVLGATGKKLRVDVVETIGSSLVEWIRSVDGAKHVCIEEGNQSAWLYELLTPYATEVICVMPRKREGAKNDAADALALAEDLRRGTLDRIVYKGTGAYGELRQAVRAHRLMTQDLSRVKHRLKSLLRSRGIPCDGERVYRKAEREVWISALPPTCRELAEMLSRELDMLQELRDRAAERLEEEASRHAIVDRLATIPGIGMVRAAYLVATVVTPHRFRSKRQFWSYCGFAVTTSSSADWVRQKGHWVRAKSTRTRGLNLNRNPVLKDIFKGAALTVAMLPDTHALKQDYLQLTARGLKPNLARLTIARKLASTALAIWKNEEVYDPSKRYRLPKRTAA